MLTYAQIKDATSFAYSAENMSGQRNGGNEKECSKIHPYIDIAPGETVTLIDDEGPGVIRHIWFTGYVGHSFIMRIYYEENDFASVETPISAFFGCAYDQNFETVDGNYPVLNSAALLVAPGRGFNSYFEMPYRRHIRITMENRSDTPKSLYYIISGTHEEIDQNAGYFHGQYAQMHPNIPGKTYEVLNISEARGFFAGLTLAAGINGKNECWVEGEARMYIDQENKPSIHYTGTEDYFGGSYGFGNDVYMMKYQTYSGLYAGMFAITGNTRERYNNQQRFLLYRLHLKDPVYFSTGFKMTLDNLGSSGARYDDYTTVAFYYLSAPAPIKKNLPDDQEMSMI